MKKHFSSAVCMAALLLVAGAAVDVNFSAASAQETQVDFDTFHDQLAQYGYWVYSGRWGEVWIPGDVPDDFHPYGTGGHWANTDQYGWTWASDYPWGDIAFHYGRWVNDPDDGWLWIPGYVWSPGWVVWRHNGQYTGWMPAPPDDEFLGNGPQGASVGISVGGLSINVGGESDNYGYSRWYGSDYSQDRYAQNWVFVGTGHIADNDYSRYEAPHDNYTSIIHNSTNITNYTVVNNYIVNKSVDPREVQQAGGHVQTVKIAEVIKKPQFITHADTGAAAQQRARTDRPRGTGLANSAPKPTPKMVQSLSVKAPPTHAGHAPMHLYTRDTVAKAPLAPTHPEAETKPGTAMTPPATKTPEKTETAPTKPETTPAETKTEKHGAEHETTPATSPTMSGPATTPAETKTEKHAHEHAATPGMEGPTMSGPATPATEPKTEKHVHEHAVAPAMSEPAKIVPTKVPPEPVHEEHVHAPVVEHPAVAAPVEPKADKETHKKPKKPEDTDAPH